PLVHPVQTYKATYAQIATTLAITGSVPGQSGAAFVRAQVDLLKDGQQQSTTTTDTSGAFRFDSLRHGNYEVRTHKEGFKTENSKVTVGNRSPGRLRVVLFVENLNQQITVSGGFGRRNGRNSIDHLARGSAWTPEG